MIDSKLQEELRARFNPDGCELRTYQLYLLDMLKDFDQICKNLGLKYWLSSGTLIGAARHGGFIPWDDDIDVEMLKEDYEKLLATFKESDKYVIQSHENDPYYFQVFGKFRDKKSILDENQLCQKYYKFHGAFIDLLTMNFTNKNASKLIFKAINILSIPLKTSKRIPRWLIYTSKVSIGLVFKFIPIIEKFYRHKNNLIFGHDYGSYFHYTKRDFSKLFPLRTATFEGYSFPVPNDIEGYLSATYPDWEKLPDFAHLQPHLQGIQYIGHN